MLFNAQNALESAVADAAMAHADSDSQERWDATQAGHRCMVYPGKRLVVYHLFLGKPEVQDTFTLIDADLDTDLGLGSKWESSDSTITYVDHEPAEIYPGVFIWHPQKSTIERVVLKNKKTSIRMSLLLRMPHHPGCTYVLEENIFNDAWGSK
jgi:hypothetical protein